MKKGYVRLLIFQIVVIILLLLNSFVLSILSDYKMFIFMLILIFLFKIFFGFEKDRHRYIKDIVLEEFIFLLTFFLLYYLSGLIFSFAKTGNYYTVKSMLTYVLPLILNIIVKEYFRYEMLQKSEGNNLLIVVSVILFFLLDVTNSLYYGSYSTNYTAFTFIALTILPAITENIALTYVNIKVGYKPGIIYLLVTKLYQILLPIIPNPNEYIVSVIRLLLPCIFAYRVYLFFKKDADERIRRDYNKKRLSNLIVPTLIVIFIVYITSGYFHFHAVAIASGSMTPNIRKGDVVVIEKIDGKFDELKEGQVIAFKYGNTIIVHRLINILKVEDKYYFYTKGDANADIDKWVVNENMVIGIVNIKVPYIGLPTVWLNEL